MVVKKFGSGVRSRVVRICGLESVGGVPPLGSGRWGKFVDLGVLQWITPPKVCV